MLKILKNNRVSGKEIYFAIESKDKNYSRWINRALNYADLKEGKDFFPKLDKSNGGRPSTDYEFTLDAAKEICLLERNEKGKQIRRWLIDISNQRENLELITVKQAAFAVKVINCLKYIDNQKQAFKEHKDTFVKENFNNLDANVIYSEFAKYRAKITGWDKAKTDAAITNYLNEHSGYNRNKVMAKDMQTKISIIDISEAIRIAVLDILYSNNEGETMAQNFANLCKNLAKEMEIKAEKENKVNLFRDKENIESIDEIKFKAIS